MKKLFLALVLSAMSFGATVAQSGMKWNESTSRATSRTGNRNVGFGFSFAYWAPGLSARFALSENLKIQATYGARGYDGYKTTNLTGEANYCFEENGVLGGQLYPLVFGNLGYGKASYDSSIYGLENSSYSWLSWSLGAGAEWFPDHYGKNIGINFKLGLGTYGTNFLSQASTVTGFVWSGGIHYYFK